MPLLKQIQQWLRRRRKLLALGALIAICIAFYPADGELNDAPVWFIEEQFNPLQMMESFLRLDESLLESASGTSCSSNTCA